MDDDLSFYANIPVEILHDRTLPPNAKLLYAEISALAKKSGYCYAANDHFVKSWGWTERTVQRLIQALEEARYIRVEQDPGKRRKIFLGISLKLPTPDKNVTPPPTEMSPTPDNFVVGNKEEEISIINTPLTPQGGASVSMPKWDPDGFEKFWNYYRSHARGEKRLKAIEAWDKLKPDKALIRTMGEALMVQVRSDDWQRGFAIPYASTWINQRRWEDVDPADPAAPPPDERRLRVWT